MSDDPLNPWTTLAVEARFEDPWIRVEQHAVINAAGARASYGLVRFKKRGVGVVPVDAEGRTFLVGQWRYPLGRYLWEVPEGGHAPEEDAIDAARRELREEVGVAARSWRPLLQMEMSTALTDERVACFLAWDLEPTASDPDPQEVLAVRRLPLVEAIDLVRRGEISDAVSVAALLRLDAMILRGELPDEVAALVAPGEAGSAPTGARPRTGGAQTE